MSSPAFKDLTDMTFHLYLSHKMIPKVSYLASWRKKIISMHVYCVYLICVYSFTYFVTTLKHSIHAAWWKVVIRIRYFTKIRLKNLEKKNYNLENTFFFNLISDRQLISYSFYLNCYLKMTSLIVVLKLK